MRTILWLCLTISGILFLLAFLIQVRRLRRGKNRRPGKLAVLFNWLLIVIFVASIGGLVWTSFYSSPAGGSTASSSSSSKPVPINHHHGYSQVSWQPHDLVMDANGDAKATFKIPANVTVKIIGQRTGTVYKVFHSKKHDRKVKYSFQYAAKYKIEIINKHGHHTQKIITVRNHENSEISSSISTSSSVQSSAASQSSSVVPAVPASRTAATRTGSSTQVSQSGNRQPSQRMTPPRASQNSTRVENNHAVQPQ